MDRKEKGMTPVHSSLKKCTTKVRSEHIKKIVKSPCPVNVVVHVIRIQPEAGHIINYHFLGQVVVILLCNGHQLGLKELGDVQ